MKRINEIARARNIAKSLGVFVAARYLARRGWSIEACLRILLRTEIRARFEIDPRARYRSLSNI